MLHFALRGLPRHAIIDCLSRRKLADEASYASRSKMLYLMLIIAEFLPPPTFTLGAML